MANLEVKKQDPGAWPLLLDPDGFIAEGTGANFFILNHSFELLTPEPRNCLRGISRAYVKKLAKKLKMDVIERNITLYDVYNAREAFFTCTPFSIMPCTRINHRLIGGGVVGRRTKHLMNKWFEEVGVDYVAQMEAWDG
jgi:branched-chain amino acid aminotransferase